MEAAAGARDRLLVVAILNVSTRPGLLAKQHCRQAGAVLHRQAKHHHGDGGERVALPRFPFAGATMVQPKDGLDVSACSESGLGVVFS